MTILLQATTQVKNDITKKRENVKNSPEKWLKYLVSSLLFLTKLPNPHSQARTPQYKLSYSPKYQKNGLQIMRTNKTTQNPNLALKMIPRQL